MPEIRDSASVHPATVTGFSTGAVDIVRRPRQPSTPTEKPHHTKVHRTVWRTAMNLANYDRHRIEVISENEVVVHNNREWRST